MHSPDFDREMSDAACFDGSVRAARFSWSYSRERLFRHCRRACFIGCFLPQGGWDPMAHPVIRSAYMEKQRMSFRLWLSRTVQDGIVDGLKKALAHPADSHQKLFASGCLRSFSRNLFDLEYSMEHREYLSDPKRPCIRECLGGQPDLFPELRRRAAAAFGKVYEFLMSGPLLRELLSLDPVCFRFQERLLSQTLDRWTVWFSPGLVFFPGGRPNMLLCSASTTSEETEEAADTALPDPAGVAAALFALHIRTLQEARPPLARLFRFNSEEAGLEEIRAADGLRTLIDSGAKAMFSLIRPDGSVFFGDFPKTSDPVRCPGCQYAGTCRLLDEWEARHC